MKLLMLVGLALVMTCMSGCKQKMKWEEQVWLEEGRFVEVERQAEGTIDFPNSSSIVTRHQEFRYDPLQVFWEKEGAAQVKSFYIAGSDAYLVTTAGKSRDNFCMGRRQGEFLLNVLRWRNGKVQEIDQHEAPLDKMRMNLSGNAHWILRKDGWAGGAQHLSWKEIARVTGQFDDQPPRSVSDFYTRTPNLSCN
ncbi:hypothetical protein Q6A26_14600 [Xanthomonas euvesicatoria pv. eucalypti]|uniref:hypothetical protein n=1 Tax=Xanthomonas TaxID=338 RepID=UPI000AF9F890|nr:hypothetical protein [Xanthomonas euvesicatoria]MDO7934042.1 hypothetical protein [Xanthomonas euvesicatoria pv. eucalypti]MDO7938242.1 hypothetical protein [Xanthomonas euvesicatoria pv. eucalypti]MDO7942399.1 hypothetical protein [Xanthomonas euvesicatoria pv. eucalypti]MDO7946680.1 hypothetical protein [Xanthomonas euvesicatoria pv. eucalypti]MDO7951022.1 hypothetical protein [Xanthomonas euvesicatoria pv. eucalypti]